MFIIMHLSALWAMRDFDHHQHYLSNQKPKDIAKTNTIPPTDAPERYQVLRNLAATQLILAIYTLTTAHAQIITRISSASPVWVWFLAVACAKDESSTITARIFVRFMVVYAVVQGGLFASFLPPA